MGGLSAWAMGPKDLKPGSHSEAVQVDATDRWEERECVIPGETCALAARPTLAERRAHERAGVSRGRSSPANGTKARTCRDGEDLNSMDGADADKHG